jgi:hypothetical protein
VILFFCILRGLKLKIQNLMIRKYFWFLFFLMMTGVVAYPQGGFNQTPSFQNLNILPAGSGSAAFIEANTRFLLPSIPDSLKVIFSNPGGFYTNTFSLKLDVPDQSYNISYTIDGSDPRNSPTAQNGGKSKTIDINPASASGRPKTPCYIVRASLKKTGFNPSFPLTQTYIFIDKVINQANPGGGWPSNDYVNGQKIDLVMDPEITKNGNYSGLMTDALTDIPSISIVTDLENLFDPETGIYVNAMDHGEEWEVFSSVELLNPNGAPGFNINAGLRIRGGWSRHGNYPKHAFRLFFRGEYGATKLRFPLFEDEGVTEFDKIDLRCEQNYSWAHPGDDRSKNTCVREVFSRDTQRDMGQPYTRSRYYHLYLNGMYWGLYQTQERSEARYASDYFGGQVEDYDVIKVNTDGYYNEATDGNFDSWEKIYNMCEKGYYDNSDYFSLEGKDAAGYPKKGGEVLIDIDNMIDYLLGIFYTGNFDAPTSSFSNNTGTNNFYAIDKRDDKSKGFVFFNHDAEHSMMIDQVGPGVGLYEDRVNLDMSVGDFSKFHPQWLHYKLTSNKEYRQRVADRVYKHFFNKGVFTPDVAEERFKKRVAEIDKAIIAESARWGDAQTNTPYTKEDWEYEINDIYTRFFPFRTDIVIDQLIYAGLYPDFDPPVIRKDNIVLDGELYTVTGSYQITLTRSRGQIYYTLDGTDPRAIGGQPANSAHEIENGKSISLNGTALVNARVRVGNEWSALIFKKFVKQDEDFSNLKVTELNYHPTDSIAGSDTISDNSFEFIEIKNTGTNPINLTGLNFATSIHYQFKENEVLLPRQFYVIASKSKWFYERYSMVPSGVFEGNFLNSGEQVMLLSSSGNAVINFQYFDIEPWATSPDGEGYSLSSVLRYPTGDPNKPGYWKASSVINGSPFADDPGIIDSNEEFHLSEHSELLYPNPTKGFLYLKIDKPQSQATIEMYTLSGTQIFQSKIEGEYLVIDLASLNINPGLYILKFHLAERESVHKVIYQP